MNALTTFAITAIATFSMASAGVQSSSGAQSTKLNEAGVKAADPRVRNALEQSKIPFTIDDDGDFIVQLDIGKTGRSQVGYISSKTQKAENLEWREIFSFGQKVDGTIDPKMAQKLLTTNSQLILGAWELVQEKGKGYAVFSVKIPADSSPEMMTEAVDATLSSADGMEKELTGKDVY
jgi:hypothetical protein